MIAGIILMVILSYMLFRRDFLGVKAMLAGLLISLMVYFMLVSILRSVDPQEAQKPFEQSINKREWKTDTVNQRYEFWRGAGKIFKKQLKGRWTKV